MATVPQTISFELKVWYLQIERPSHLPVVKTFQFEVFEEMLTFYRKERKRRALADRATKGVYRQVLTDHGKQVCATDEYALARHQDAIKGTEFTV